MTNRLIISFLLLTPFSLFGQTAFDTLSADQTREIYTVIETVIKSEKLSKKFGLQLQPASNCNINYDDTPEAILAQIMDAIEQSKSYMMQGAHHWK
ncbi:MAG: hypothetical protein EOP04_21175, partial [Proteobacteria bacterium]